MKNRTGKPEPFIVMFPNNTKTARFYLQNPAGIVAKTKKPL